MAKNNPARRVLSVVATAAQIRDMNCFDGWRKVLFILENDKQDALAEILNQLKILREQFSLCEEEIRTMKGSNAPTFLKYSKEIKEFLAASDFHGSFDRYRSLINDAVIHSLDVMASECSPDIPEDFDYESLEKFHDKLNSLWKEIKGARIHSRLKKFLLSVLEKAQRGIARFEIYGAVGLKEALKEILGEGIVDKEVVQIIKNEQPSMFAKFSEVVQTLDSFVSLATNTPLLIQNAPFIAALLSN